MLSSRASASLPPYIPLPQNAYAAAREGVLQCGFSDKAILGDYSFSNVDGAEIKINALVLAHETYRTAAEYASLTVYNASEDWEDDALVKVLAHSAAPFHLIHRNNKFALWGSSVSSGKVSPIEIRPDITYQSLAGVLNEYRQDLNPKRIINAKLGREQFTHPFFREMHPMQLAIWALDVTRPLLVSHFSHAVNALRRYIRSESTVEDIGIQLLGASILADTGVLGDSIRQKGTGLGFEQLLEIASEHFPEYFKTLLIHKHARAAQEALSVLRSVRYSGFAPDMLTDLYREAYTQKQRKELGRYDTPLFLTRRIWETLPVEFLAPNERVIADMTCGWGSFLVAAYERITHLGDTSNLSLREYLYGNDKDQFAARLAGLGLLLSTSSDTWHIDHEDALEWDWLNKHQPNIIVGNPPFGGSRKEHLSTEGERIQKADKFLQRAISRLAPNGYLAMLMPRSFIAAEASPELRKELVNECDILELWELPTKVFSEAMARTIVLFAQKKSDNVRHMPVRLRTVQPSTTEDFKRSGVFTHSGFLTDQSVWSSASRKSAGSKNTHIMDYWLVLSDVEWQKIKNNSISLDQVSRIIPGAIMGSRREQKRWKDYKSPRKVKWLSTAKKTLPRQFCLDYSQSETILYPNDLVEPRIDNEDIFRASKILLTSNQDTSWGKRVKLGIDRRGYYVSDGFWLIAKKDKAALSHITIETLAAVVGWIVGNAWIVEHLRHPKIPARAIRTIPFPRNLSSDDSITLTSAILQIEEASKRGIAIPAELLRSIDNILKAAYQLDDDIFERLYIVAEWDKNPKITIDPLVDTSDATWIISGIVDHLNLAEGTITLWLDGFDELQTVPIIPFMPGWMLRPEAEFITRVPRECVRKRSLQGVVWGSIAPNHFAYRSEEELYSDLTTKFHPANLTQ